MDIATLPVRVDKSYLITIGERLYAESIELVRELVNNAYDADVTEVRVTVAPDEVQRDLEPYAPAGSTPVETTDAALSQSEPAAAPMPAARRRRPRLRRLTSNAVVHLVRFGDAGVACCLDHFGPDSPEAFHEGTTIYVNRDHPLYLRNSRRRDTHTLHLARLLTQEISMMKDPRSPRQAFERQSKLLRDAFADHE